MFKLTKISQVLQLTFFGLIALSVIRGMIEFNTLENLIDYQQVRISSNELAYRLQNARKAELGFIQFDARRTKFHQSGSDKNYQLHASEMRAIDSILQQLNKMEQIEALGISSRIPELRYNIREYADLFKQLAELIRQRGFENYGIEGKMREYAHELQSCQSEKEQVLALMLRRHEKDFFLRKDLKYVQQFQDKAASLKALYHTDDYSVKMKKTVEGYEASFMQIVAIEQEIGLDESKGLLGKLAISAQRIEPTVEAIKVSIAQKNNRVRRDSIIIFATTFLLLILGGMAMVWLLRKTISKPLTLLNQVVVGFMKGEKGIEEQLSSLKSRNEIGNLANNFRQMLLQIQGNLQDISDKNAQLEISATEEQKRNWIAEGLAKFNDLTRKSEDTISLTHDVIVELAKYTNSAQGAIYLAEQQADGETLLKMYSCYAYGRKKFIQDAFKPGEGLVGAAFLEKDTIFHTDIPDNYVHITSGLGETKPRCLLLVPIMDDNYVEGVIEMASLHIYNAHEKELVTRLARRLAGLLASMKNQERTKHLLMESQMMTERLRASEEELRQNLEELEATQEEMHRLSQESTQKLQICQEQLSIYLRAMEHQFQGVALLNERFQMVSANQFINIQLSSNEAIEWRAFFAKSIRAKASNHENFFSHSLPMNESDYAEFDIRIVPITEKTNTHYAVFLKIAEWVKA
jgi:GAF domain